MKGLDLRKFKKVSSDAKMTTLKHPDGHEIRIAHGALKGDLKHQLEKLPAMADGGTVPAKPIEASVQKEFTPSKKESLPDSNVVNANQQQMTDYNSDAKKAIRAKFGYAEGGKVEAPSSLKPNEDFNDQDLLNMSQSPAALDASRPDIHAYDNMPAGQISTETASPQPLVNQAPTNPAISQGASNQAPQPQLPGGATDYQSLLNEGNKVISGQQAIDTQQAKGREDIRAGLAEQHLSPEEIAQTSQASANHISQQLNAALQDYKDQHIEPGRLWQNASFPSKVAASIGIILSGVGGAASHQDNAALGVIHKQIEQDIAAQQAEMGKKHNVISALESQFHNVKDQATFMRGLYADIYADKLDEMSAKMGSPIAAQKAQAAKFALHAQYAPAMAELAWRNGILHSDAPVAQKVLALPKEDQKAATEELGKYQEGQKLREDLLNAHRQVSNMTLNGTFSPSQRSSLVDLYGGVLGKLSEGRYNEEAAKKQIDSMLPGKLDLSDETKALKLKQINNFMDTLFQPPPTLQKWGITPPKSKLSSVQTNRR